MKNIIIVGYLILLPILVITYLAFPDMLRSILFLFIIFAYASVIYLLGSKMEKYKAIIICLVFGIILVGVIPKFYRVFGIIGDDDDLLYIISWTADIVFLLLMMLLMSINKIKEKKIIAFILFLILVGISPWVIINIWDGHITNVINMFYLLLLLLWLFLQKNFFLLIDFSKKKR